MSVLTRLLPFLTWFKDYNGAAFRADLISGLTVALVLVPQSMAYAQLAGLPAYYGLYAAFLPPMIASLFGSSRQLATGPVAVVSLMTAATLEPLATAGSDQFVVYALLLALLVGLFQFALGVLRLGVVVNFLSHPVVNGFTNAAALIIATSQLSKIFGIYVDKAPHHYETIYRVIVAAIHYTHWPTVGMAALAFTLMIGLRRINPRIPNVLVAVVVTTFLAWITGFEDNTTAPVKHVVSPGVAAKIRAFNQAIETKETLEQHRAASKKTWAEIGQSDRGACLQCHGQRDLNWFGKPSARQLEPSGRALVLHDMSGLLDRHIAALKQEISRHRTDLRGMLFARETDSGRFHLRGELPPGTAVASGTWRIKVGNARLDPRSLTMTGGGAVVAQIPKGLPGFRAPRLDWSVIPGLLAAALIISLLGFMEAISIAKAMAARTRQKLDPNQELVGQGLSNIVGCMFQSYAVSGSFSRSAVNLQAGARTGLSNVFSSGVVVIVLLFLASWLYHLPQAVLASIIMMAVFGLLNTSGFVHAWRTSRFDGAVSIITFVGTLLFAPHLENGIFIGVALSLGAYLYRSMRPQVVELAPHPDGSMKDARRRGLKKCRHVAVVSFEGPLNFASASYLESEILGRVADLPDLKHVLISGNGISEVDASGEETLRHVVENLRGAGYAVSFSGVPEKVIDVLRRAHLYQYIGEENFYGTRAQAIAAIYADAHADSDEVNCPYREAMPPVVELSLHEDGSLRNAERHGLERCRHIAALRFDAPLNFANTGFLEQEILGILADRPSLRHLLFVSHGISDVDDVGAQKLASLVQKLRNDGFACSFSGLKEEVLDVLGRNQATGVIGHENIYPTQVMAVAGIYAKAHAGSSETDCPLWPVAPHLTEMSLHDSGTIREAGPHHLRLCQQIGIVRLDGPLVLTSQRALESEFIRWVKTRPTIHTVILVTTSVGKLSGAEASNLHGLVVSAREAGLRVLIANLGDRALEDLGRSGFADAIGLEDIYPSVRHAVAAAYVDAHSDGDEEQCPLADMMPRVTELALHPNGSLRDARRHGLALCKRIVALRFDGPLNYANTAYLEVEVRRALEGRPEARHLLFAGHTLTNMDSVAAEQIPRLVVGLKRDGYRVVVSGLNDEGLELLRRGGGARVIGADNLFPTQVKALEQIHAEAHKGADEVQCPLMTVVRKEG